MTPPTQDDFIKYRLDEADARDRELREYLRQIRAEMRDGFSMISEKFDSRASATEETVRALLALRSEFDSYKRTGKVLIGVSALFGGFLAWVLDIFDRIPKFFGKG